MLKVATMILVTPFASGREKLVATFVPRMTLVRRMFAGGGKGGAVLSASVTPTPFAACGAAAGLTLEIWLVAVAETGMGRAKTAAISQIAKTGLLMGISSYQNCCYEQVLRRNGDRPNVLRCGVSGRREFPIAKDGGPAAKTVRIMPEPELGYGTLSR